MEKKKGIEISMSAANTDEGLDSRTLRARLGAFAIETLGSLGSEWRAVLREDLPELAALSLFLAAIWGGLWWLA